jgi:glycosyltransferase involved in cell wall biosynthesis
MASPITPPASRNDPCPCGSGRRYKHCHGAVGAPAVAAVSPRVDVDALAAQALALHQADELEQAETLYRRVLDTAPDHADVLHMLGVVRAMLGDAREAQALIARAGELTGWQFAEFRHNFAFALSLRVNGRVPLARERALLALRAERQRRLDAATEVSDAFVTVAGLVDLQAALDGIDDGALVGFATLPDLGGLAAHRCHLAATAAGSGARWVIGSLRRAQSAPPGSDRYEGSLTMLHHASLSDHVAALLLTAPWLPLVPDNMIVRADLLRQALTELPSDAPPDLPALVLALIAFEEPWIAGRPLEPDTALQTAIDRELATLDDVKLMQDVDRHVGRMLLPPAQWSPLAPQCPDLQLDVLKQPLRSGLGYRLSAPRLAEIAARLERVAALPAPALANEGLDLVGFVRAESGLGETARSLARACEAVGVPVAVSDVALDYGIRKGDASIDHLRADQPRHRVQLLCVNPDAGDGLASWDGEHIAAHRYRIGYWAWELERIPRQWERNLPRFREIWTLSDFVTAAVKRSATCPVFTVPPPIHPVLPDRAYARSEFGLADNAFVFLYAFAYGSFAERKNPRAVITAFRRAFPRGDEPVQLIIKSSQSAFFPAEVEALHAACGGDRRIIWLDRFLTRGALAGLQACCDAFVSLHRSEGFGLSLAEMMLLGKPVIATAYSANLDFMDDRTGYLVDWKPLPLGPRDYIEVPPGAFWADPDLDHAARLMRHVVAQPDEARRKGEAARQRIANDYSDAAVGRIIAARLERIRSLPA